MLLLRHGKSGTQRNGHILTERRPLSSSSLKSTVPSLGATLPHVPITINFFQEHNAYKMKLLICLESGRALDPPSKSTDGWKGESMYLNPIMGHSLQMLHLAWCLAVSAAATLCRTGSHTMDCGSSLIQSRKRAASISGLLLACNTREKWQGLSTPDLSTHQLINSPSCSLPVNSISLPWIYSSFSPSPTIH